MGYIPSWHIATRPSVLGGRRYCSGRRRPSSGRRGLERRFFESNVASSRRRKKGRTAIRTRSKSAAATARRKRRPRDARSRTNSSPGLLPPGALYDVRHEQDFRSFKEGSYMKTEEVRKLIHDAIKKLDGNDGFEPKVEAGD
mmetsp:Transcript_12013/g.26005  ORF Transcript_12013/g.26005 Transcript_12013/m.26005 type:complete len:142 (+) Transcript_12013:63-488(+)